MTNVACGNERVNYRLSCHEWSFVDSAGRDQHAHPQVHEYTQTNTLTAATKQFNNIHDAMQSFKLVAHSDF